MIGLIDREHRFGSKEGRRVGCLGSFIFHNELCTGLGRQSRAFSPQSSQTPQTHPREEEPPLDDCGLEIKRTSNFAECQHRFLEAQAGWNFVGLVSRCVGWDRSRLQSLGLALALHDSHFSREATGLYSIYDAAVVEPRRRINVEDCRVRNQGAESTCLRQDGNQENIALPTHREGQCEIFSWSSLRFRRTARRCE